ncbi:MAG: hypothetical protein ACI8TQ_000999 [Planctomycetota bacterium]|jgi:hypothetical protein
MDMGLSESSLLASLIVSTIGFGFFSFGKKQSRIPQLVTGIALMIFPYFVEGASLMLGVAMGILAGMYVAIRVGA